MDRATLHEPLKGVAVMKKNHLRIICFTMTMALFCFVESPIALGDTNISISNNSGIVIGENYGTVINAFDENGLHYQTAWEGPVQAIADTVKGWEENGKDYQYFLFGRYMQETGYDDPLLWRVLTVNRQSNRVLLLSDKILYAIPYGDTRWENSNVYQWLHDTFLEYAFNDSERSALYSGNNRGTIFILSVNDYRTPEYGFSKDLDADISRKAESTTYARDCGLIYDNTYYTQTRASETAMHAVMSTGRIQEVGYARNDVGVRPAMWIDLNKADFALTGDGTKQFPLQLFDPTAQ